MKHAYLVVVLFLLAAFVKAPSSIVQNDQIVLASALPDYSKPFPKAIIVSSVEELYTAVNGPNDDGKGNEGARILLQPGKYILSAFVSKGGKILSRPNMGRIEFQKDMQISGDFQKKPKNNSGPQKNGPAKGSESIIDGSQLPPASFQLNEGDAAPKRTGFIRMGKGNNVLSHVTVIGNTTKNSDGSAVALSAIDTDLCDNPSVPSDNVSVCSNATVRIEHNLIMDGQTGIDIRNGGARSMNRLLTAHISDNEIKNMKTAAGQGITIQNSVGATGAVIIAELKANVSHFNKVGIRVMNQHTNSGKITVTSNDDWFEDNEGNGILLYGGMDINNDATSTSANGNSITFNGHKNHIKNNGGKFTLYADIGGVYVVGGYTEKVPGRTSNNFVQLNLTKPEFSNNKDADINVYGARSGSESTGAAGVSNSVNILIHLAPACIVKTMNSDHPASPETNIVTVKKTP
jgi:hypothetical protein